MATYWVEPPPAGNDGNPGTFLSPWASPQHALDTCIAGDICNFKDGTYDVGTGVDADTNSGSIGNVITFQAVNSRLAIWELTANGRILEVNGVDYITFDGIDFKGDVTFAQSTHIYLINCENITFDDCEPRDCLGRAIAMWGGVKHLDILNCEIHMETTDGEYDGIYSWGAGNEDLYVYNTEVYHIAHTGIGMKACDGILIEECYIHDTYGHCISLTSSGGAGPKNIVIRNNQISGAENWGPGSDSPHNGIRITEDAENVECYRNDIWNCDARGIEIWSNAIGPIYCYNNTLYDNNQGLYSEGSFQFYNTGNDADPEVNFRNNIIYHTQAAGASQFVMYVSSNVSDNLTMDYNLWYSTGVVEMRRNGTTYANFALYAAAYEANSVFSDDPDFTNAGAADFTLLVTSPAIDAGVDVGLPYQGTAPDIGAHEYETIPPSVTVHAASALAVDSPCTRIAGRRQ